MRSGCMRGSPGAVAQFLPGSAPSPVRVSAYMDGSTPDGHGLIGLVGPRRAPPNV
jgi:hypothetical protein